VPPAPEEARRLLCTLGDHVRDLVVASRRMDMVAVVGETVADTSGGGRGGTVVVLSEGGALATSVRSSAERLRSTPSRDRGETT
jgi:hypothetical protein